MKKVYKKPEMYVEHFSVAQNIAAGCGVPGGGTSLGKPSHWSKETCGWDMGNTVLWLESGGICNEYVGADEDIAGICYNNPSGGMTIFSS